MITFDLQTFAEEETVIEPSTETTDTETTESRTENTVENTGGAQIPNEPEALDFEKVTIPEGITLDDDFKALAKNIGLTNEGTSKLLAYAKTGVFDRIAKTQQEAQQEVLEGWAKESQTQYSGEKLEIAKHAYNTYATEGLRKFMDETGLGSHPEVVGLFYKLGMQMAEGKLVLGGGHENPNSANVMFAKSVSMMGK